MLDYKLIEAFAMVILEGGFEKAARKLNLTQSAVSQRVKQLEDQFGRILLNRLSPPEPTEQGLPLLIHYRQVAQLEADLTHCQGGTMAGLHSSLAIGINADSFATWFYPAIRDLLDKERIVLDLYVDDQELTQQFLKEGKVWGCISTRRQPLQGCRVTRLGRMHYGLFATPAFMAEWFPKGLTLSAAEQAPIACYNRKDDLHTRIFSLILGDQPKNPPTFYLPSSEMYCRFVAQSSCYGVLPSQQSDPLESANMIVNLCPSCRLYVDLYWHRWNLRSTIMERFDTHLLASSRQLLDQSSILFSR